MKTSRSTCIPWLLSALLAGCSLLPIPAASTLTATAPATAAIRPVIETLEINETLAKPPLTLKARYPRMTHPGNPRYDDFNRAAEALVRTELENFSNEITRHPIQADPVGSGSFMEITYEVILSDGNLASILFTLHFYVSGAAHPNQVSRALNYDARSGQILLLGNLFQPTASYLGRLVEYCITDLKRQNALMWSENLKTDESSLHSWAIQPDGLRFVFDPYEVAPYAMGPQQVFIPFNVIKDVINFSGPLAGLIK